MLADRIGGLITMIFGAIAISEAVRLYPSRMSTYVGDYLMPGVVGAAMILLGLITLIRKGKSFPVPFPDKAVLRKMLLVMGLLFVYWGIIHVLGYILSTLIISIALFRVFGSYPYGKSAIYSVILTAVIYLVFDFWLRMPFPAGVFHY